MALKNVTFVTASCMALIAACLQSRVLIVKTNSMWPASESGSTRQTKVIVPFVRPSSGTEHRQILTNLQHSYSTNLINSDLDHQII